MSFDIRECAGKPEAVLYAVENYGLHHESKSLAKPAIDALREVVRRLGKCTPTVTFRARGFVENAENYQSASDYKHRLSLEICC